MKRLTADGIKVLMHEKEYKCGESCIEYVGYGYAFNFAQYLMSKGFTFNEDYYDTFDGLKDKGTAYLDVVNAFNKDYDSDNEEVLTFVLFPSYMAENATDEEYNEFISYLKEE